MCVRMPVALRAQELRNPRTEDAVGEEAGVRKVEASLDNWRAMVLSGSFVSSSHGMKNMYKLPYCCVRND